MNPQRLKDSAQTPAEQIVATAAQVTPQPVSNEWAEVLKDAARPSRSGAWWSLLLVPAAVALLWVPSRTVEREVRPDENARWVETAPGEVSLQSGRLAVTAAANIKVTTPELSLHSQNARFLAEVTENGTTIWVEEGEVVARTRTGQRTVKAGESTTWPPERTAPIEAPPPPIAGDDALEVQSSMYERGLAAAKRGEHEAALAAWRESLTRFPDGVLHPEVRLALFRELLRTRRFNDAREVGQGFVRECSDDPRRSEVERILKQLPRR